MEGKRLTRRFISGICLMLLGATLAISGCRQMQGPWVPKEKCPQDLDLDFEICPDRKMCSEKEKLTLFRRLQAHDVQIDRVGSDMRIIIPSDLLFYPKSANFDEHYVDIIHHISTLLWCYRKVDVHVAGYTDCCGDQDHNRQLSLLQAQKVAKLLWYHQPDARLVYTKGFGADYPISGNKYYYQRSRNRRIEITFRDIPYEQ